MFLLNLTKPFSNPKGPKNSILPLSSALVICPPKVRILFVIYLL